MPLVVVGWVVACSSTTTQAPGLEIVVQSEGLRPGVDFDSVDVRVEQEIVPGTWTDRYQRSQPLSVRPLPMSIAVLRGQSVDQEVRITVTALLGSAPGAVAQRVAQLLMPSDRLAELVLVLSSRCLGKPAASCGANESCQPSTGACGSNLVDVASLGAYAPGDQNGVDAGTGSPVPPRDGGASDATAPDAAPPGDAGGPSPDGEGPSPDAGGPLPDAGVCSAGAVHCNGQQPQTCKDGQWQDTGPACAEQACLESTGTCGGVCAPSRTQCVVGQNATRACGVDGTWGPAAPCVASTCATGACQGTCVVGTTKCDDQGALQTCDAAGTWGVGVACTSGVCAPGSGQCAGNCTPNDTQCSGTAAMQTCGASGTWAAAVRCSNQTCLGKACTGVCGPGQTRCDPSVTTIQQTCDGKGAWVEGTAVSGICGAQCTPGTSPGTCAGLTPSTCAASGRYVAGAACPLFCAQGACTACTAATNGLTCGADLVCAASTCASAEWAEWPMPNDPGQANAASYTDNGDGTVTDNVTGLMWQKVFSTTTSTWANAPSVCASLTLGGYQGFRLPTVIELASIIDSKAVNPAINSTFFPGVTTQPFWSSTPIAGSSTLGWYVNFDAGYPNFSQGPTASIYVRCVR